MGDIVVLGKTTPKTKNGERRGEIEMVVVRESQELQTLSMASINTRWLLFVHSDPFYYKQLSMFFFL